MSPVARKWDEDASTSQLCDRQELLFEVMPTLAQRSEQLYAFHCSTVSLSVSFCRQNVYEINLRKEGFALAHNVRYNVSHAGKVC